MNVQTETERLDALLALCREVRSEFAKLHAAMHAVLARAEPAP